jgi:hypothetical protein
LFLAEHATEKGDFSTEYNQRKETDFVSATSAFRLSSSSCARKGKEEKDG